MKAGYQILELCVVDVSYRLWLNSLGNGSVRPKTNHAFLDSARMSPFLSVSLASGVDSLCSSCEDLFSLEGYFVFGTGVLFGYGIAVFGSIYGNDIDGRDHVRLAVPRGPWSL